MTKYVILQYRNGGADSLDEFIPYDAKGYALEAGLRSTLWTAYTDENAAYSRANADLLPISMTNNPEFTSYTWNDATTSARSWALPPQLPGRQARYQASELAIIANVGTLLEPLNYTEYSTGVKDGRVAKIPGSVGAHNTQMNMWFSGAGELYETGWAGRMLDNLARKNSRTDAQRRFEAISTGGLASALVGYTASPLEIGTGSTVPNWRPYMTGFGVNSILDESNDSAGALDLWHDIVTGNRGVSSGSDVTPANSSVSEWSKYVSEARKASYEKGNDYETALAVSVDEPTNPGTPYDVDIFDQTYANGDVNAQYENICRIIARIEEQPTLFDSPEVVFFQVMVTDFDTHSGQAAGFPVRISEQDSAGELTGLNAADDSLREQLDVLGVLADTIVVPWSEFGRTMIDNSRGTDHGWGGNVMPWGGPVQGGKIYHNGIPEPDTDDDYVVNRARGVWVPTLSVEQYFATIGLWLGLTEDELMYGVGGTQANPTADAPFPNLPNMDLYPGTSSRTIPWLNLA